MDTLSALNTQTIIPTNDINSGKTAQESAAEDAAKQELDFLNILLTQLENQNPLDPMDTDEYTAQLTRYSQLEQQIETNEQLVIANDYLKTNSASSTFSYIGQDVEISSNIAVTQNGEAEWSYLVEGAASDVILTVTDEDGNVIEETSGSLNAGAQNFTLDTQALGIQDGQQLYLSINARDSKNNNINTQTTSHVKVDGAWTDDQGQTYLTAGDISFRDSDILKVIDS
jgi:flagellar basal-body rod modification protein FlgD